MTPITPIIPNHDLPVTVYAKDQPEYIALPAHQSPDGMVTTRWRLSIRERIKLMIRGDLWHYQLTFGKALQPIKMDVNPPQIDQ